MKEKAIRTTSMIKPVELSCRERALGYTKQFSGGEGERGGGGVILYTLRFVVLVSLTSSLRKLVIIGDGACGKTSLLSVFTLGYFPTVCFIFDPEALEY